MAQVQGVSGRIYDVIFLAGRDVLEQRELKESKSSEKESCVKIICTIQLPQPQFWNFVSSFIRSLTNSFYITITFECLVQVQVNIITLSLSSLT